jgi:site-specific DNA-methyltransferase (adenine-specific)/adenine-specific DNA-methyltransferase
MTTAGSNSDFCFPLPQFLLPFVPMPTLNWIGKDAVVNHHHQVPFHLLKDVPELACGDPGSGNLIVQGDNLVALKALLPYYAGQIKCIYIDPPYNTGNEGWIYNDNVNSPLIREWLGKAVGKEAEDLSRHDKWLCLMYPRLSLLRQFLREDGAIFVSLDDNEISSLRFAMDEIFGQQNFATMIIWEKNYAPKASAKYLSENHDYVAVYAKSIEKWQRNLLPRSEKQDKAYKNPDNDPRGLWRPNNLAARNPYSLGTYSITCPSGRVIPGPPKGSYWRVSKQKFEEMDRDGRIWWGKDGNNVPAPKIFLTEVKQGVVPMTIWTYSEAGHTQDAKKQLLDVLPQAAEVFSTPKPTQLIERIARLASNPGDLILDSFAGSGTTGNAVLNLNKATLDSKPRRFIMVEIESKIARDITAERVKRVAQGYTNAKGEKVEGLGGSFRFCELGETLFDEHGQIKPSVRFADLARHVYFTETGEPLPRERVLKSPLIGECRGVGIYLLFNGILGDKSANGGNILTRGVLAQLPSFDGQKVIYCAGCLLGKDRLQAERITIRQTPYEIKVS